MRMLFLVLVVVGSVMGGVTPNTEASRVQRLDRVTECTDMFGGSLSTMSSSFTGQKITINLELLSVATRPLCERLSKKRLLDSYGECNDNVKCAALFRKEPALFVAPCRIIADVGARMQSKQVADMLTLSEWNEFVSGLCKFAFQYVGSDGGLQHEKLMREHPEIAAPVCAGAFAQAFLPNARPGVSVVQLKRAGRNYCIAALKAGVIIYHGGSNFETKKTQQYYALLRRYFAPLLAS